MNSLENIIHKGKVEENATIYSYTLHYRYRWKIPMIIMQLVLLALFSIGFLYTARFEATQLVSVLGQLALLWMLQGFSFWLYCFTSSYSLRWHIDAFLSPWGGWRTKQPLSIIDYQQNEWLFFSLGIAISLFIGAWWGLLYGYYMGVFHVVCSIPRLLTVFQLQKWKQTSRPYIIKHEPLGIGLYSTTG
ncbi:hypothetical protein [Aneurinibacillus uraniidurans]|uniref:hypothetical protein n=1 Tax=Aneurinibacillus uraniidurans TaxID=2966586 RepID=UPI00234A120C|nr:hypothetical protein [Aneurinibacillus sp. B1]WCN37812.1 hypothetical protein PO771_19115 [Aneurinibacillus sp. B1]